MVPQVPTYMYRDIFTKKGNKPICSSWKFEYICFSSCIFGLWIFLWGKLLLEVSHNSNQINIFLSYHWFCLWEYLFFVILNTELKRIPDSLPIMLLQSIISCSQHNFIQLQFKTA